MLLGWGRRYHASLVRRAERSAEDGGVNGVILEMQWAVTPCFLPLVALLIISILVPISDQVPWKLAVAAGGASITWMLYVSAIFVRALWHGMDVKKQERLDV